MCPRQAGMWFFLFLLISDANAANNHGCSSLKELHFVQTTSNDSRTVTLNLKRPAFVSNINILTCADDKALANGIFNVTYVDPTDMAGQDRVYSNEIQGAFLDNGRHFSINLDPHIYATSLTFSHHHAILCSEIFVIGCGQHSVCDSNFCQNGGTCVGNGQCACVSGYMGPTCDIPVKEMTFDDFELVTDMLGILYTKAAAFNVTGDVSFSYNDSDGDVLHSRRNSRSLGQSRSFANFFGHSGSLNLVSSLMAGFQQSHHNTFGHFASHGVYSALHNFAHGFSHTVQAIFGHGHHHGNRHYFYTTHGTNHFSHGSSLHYSNHHLHMHVHFVNTHGHQNHFHLWCPFKTTPGVKYTIVSSYSPHFGVSLFVNGHKLCSLTVPNIIHSAQNHFGIPRPLCIGLCGAHHAAGPSNLFIGNIAAAGASVATLAANSLVGLLGLPMLNLLGASHHTTAGSHLLSSTVLATKTTVASGGRFTPAPTTTLPPATATSARILTTTTTTITTTNPQGPVCYACANLNMIGTCSTTSQCYSGEVCTVYSGNLGYTHRCMSKQLCESNKKTAKGCWNCCTSNLCNDKCVTTSTCQDQPRCATLLSIGYNVCNDPVASVLICPHSCNKCAHTG